MSIKPYKIDPVKSSYLAGIGQSTEDVPCLVVQYKNGKVFKYPTIIEATLCEVLLAPSLGSAVRTICKGVPYVEIKPQEDKE